MAVEQRYAFKDIIHYFCAKYKVIDIMGGGGQAALLIEVNYLQLTWPSRW
jgi:hypothetical protein